jgi:hypothetical protein
VTACNTGAVTISALPDEGQQAMAASISVAIASDQSAVEVVGDAAENAPVAGNPVLTGGRYDLTPRTLGDGDVGAIALDDDGAVHVSDGGNSLTIDGTITANAGTNLNTSALALEGGGNLDIIAGDTTSLDSKVTACNTGAVVVSSSALPTGASTAAKQPALGTAGTASTDVITVQGIAAMTALLVDGSATTQPVSGTVTANLGTIAGVATQTTLAAVQTAVEIMGDWDETNRCAVNLISGQVGVAGGTGIDGATVQRVTLATDIALPAGTNAIGKLAANSGVDIGDVDVTSIAAGTNLIGNVGLSGTRTTGGTTPYYNDGTATETQIKGTGGQIYWIHCMNLRASVAYLQLFNNTAVGVTPGTTTPTNEFVLPTQGDTNGAGFTLSIPNGLAYGTGITYFISTTKGGATAATADEVLLNLGYA